MANSLPRWGVRFTEDPTHNKQYTQTLYDIDPANAKRGELFLNEPLEEIYYVGADGVCHKLNENMVVSFSNIDFTGLREFADDAEAALADPIVPVGGMYRTGNLLKVRLI